MKADGKDYTTAKNKVRELIAPWFLFLPQIRLSLATAIGVC